MRLTKLGHTLTLAAALVAIAACDVVFAQKESETVNKTVALPANGTLKLRNFSGKVTITGTGGHDVVIKAVRTAGREQLDHIKLKIETTGSTVTIDANDRDSTWGDRHDDNVVKTEFDIQVPASAALDVYGFSSDLNISGVTGSQKLETFSGDVTVDAKAAGNSPLLSVTTFSGDITAKVSESVKAEVAFSSFSGRFNSDVPVSISSNRNVSRARGRTNEPVRSTSDNSNATLKFHTFSGDAKLIK